MALKRGLQKRLTRIDALAARAKNRIRKKGERTRRDARMVEILKSSSPPFSPPVMSWLSRKLGKKAGRITPEDISTLLS